MSNTLFTLIFGPTASGKTAWALEQAQKHKAWILAADSRQVYSGIDVVSGKDIPPNFHKIFWQSSFGTLPAYQGENDHLLLFGFDLVAPDQSFSVSQYVQSVEPLIEYCRAAQQPLIIVGGTWQYLEALIAPPASLSIPPIPPFREELAKLPLAQLQERLRIESSETWNRLNESDRLNPRRLIRAIEVASQLSATSIPEPLIASGEYQLFLREKPLNEIEPLLSERIESRLKLGALEEVRQLVEKFPSGDAHVFTATGCQELADSLREKITLEEAKRQWWLQERQYAKRQLTWLKKVATQYQTLEAKLADESHAPTLNANVGRVNGRHS